MHVFGKQAFLCPLDSNLSCRNCPVFYEIWAMERKLENAGLRSFNVFHLEIFTCRKFGFCFVLFSSSLYCHNFWRFSYGRSWDNLLKWNLYQFRKSAFCFLIAGQQSTLALHKTLSYPTNQDGTKHLLSHHASI